MSLPILVVIVVVGITLSVAAVHFTGGSRMATLADADAAVARFAADFPDERVSDVRLTADRKTAFLFLERRRTGIVHAIGDCFLTRIVAPGVMAAAAADDASTVSVSFHDVTWKGGRFVFADRADAWAVLLALAADDQGRRAA